MTPKACVGPGGIVTLSIGKTGTKRNRGEKEEVLYIYSSTIISSPQNILTKKRFPLFLTICRTREQQTDAKISEYSTRIVFSSTMYTLFIIDYFLKVRYGTFSKILGRILNIGLYLFDWNSLLCNGYLCVVFRLLYQYLNLNRTRLLNSAKIRDGLHIWVLWITDLLI